MGRLMLTRKADQGLRFTIKSGHLDNISDLIRHGLTVTVSEVTREGKVRIAVEAPDSVLILRDELELLV